MSAAEAPQRTYLERAATLAGLAEELLADATQDYGQGVFLASADAGEIAGVAHAHAAVGQLLLALWERTHPR